MNKKIKVIELFNKIANNEKMPKKIKWEKDILTYEEDVQDYMGISKTGSGSFFNYLFVNNATALFINDEAEILEDEEEIDIQDIEENKTGIKFEKTELFTSEGLNFYFDTITMLINEERETQNKLIKAVKQLDKKINKED